MSAVKSGNSIVIQAESGNLSLSDVTTQINDTSFIENMGSGVFRIKCPVGRILYIYEGSKLTIGINETLEIYTSITGATGYFDIRVYGGKESNIVGGILEMLEGSTYKGKTSDSAANTFRTNIFIGGGASVIGTELNPVKFYYTRNISIPYMSSGVNQLRYHNDEIKFQYCQFDNVFPGAVAFVLGYHLRTASITIDNITLFNSDNNTSRYLISINGFFPQLRISNIHIGDTPTAAYKWRFSYGGTIGKISNVNFNSLEWNAGYLLSPSSTPMPQFIYGYYERNFLFVETNQIYQVFENCLFGDQNYTYYGYLSGNSVVLLKDCTLDGTVRRWLIYNGSKLLCWNSPEHLTLNMAAVGDNGGSLVEVFGLDLTVTDLNDNPIEDATIIIEQKDGYENSRFKTNSLGKIKDLYDYNVAICAHRLVAYGVNLMLSDSSNSSYHTVTVLKEGYKAETFNIVMDADKEVTVQLENEYVQLPEGYTGELTGPLAPTGGDNPLGGEMFIGGGLDSDQANLLKDNIYNTYINEKTIRIPKNTINGQEVTSEIIEITIASALSQGLITQESLTDLRQLSDTMADTIIEHIKTYAETEGSTNEIIDLKDHVSTVNNNILQLYDTLSSWVPVTMDGGGALKIALSSVLPDMTAELTQNEANMQSTFIYETMDKNII